MTKAIEHRYLATGSANLATRAEGEGDGSRAGGYAALHNSESQDLGGFVEVLAPGAFSRSLAAVAAGEANVFAFWQHDSSTILASTRSNTLTLSEDETGLAFDFDTDGMTDQQRKALARGDLQVSFGFYVREEQWSELTDGTFKRTVLDLELTEISLVTYPAYTATTVAIRSLEAFKAQATPEVETDLIQNDGQHEARLRKLVVRERLAKQQ
jgi:hypothetical protein